MTLKHTLFSSLMVLTSACALMEPRAADRSNFEEEEYAAYSAHKTGSLQAFDELGLNPSRKLSEDERNSLDRRMKLVRMEREIASETLRDQYYNYRGYMESDEEKIRFLNLPNKETRDRYAMDRGIYFKTNKHEPSVRDAVQRSDIILGMSKDAVVESWGEPSGVEVAGNRYYGNERWRYVEYISTAEGYQKEERYVIFENGKVVGWQRN